MTDTATSSTAPPVGEVIDWDISPAARQLNGVRAAEGGLFLFGIWLLFLGGKQVFSLEQEGTRVFLVMSLIIPLAVGVAAVSLPPFGRGSHIATIAELEPSSVVCITA